MSNTDKLREIVEKTFPLFGSRLDEWRKVERDRLLSDLTALISEHYYPKKFVEWKDKNTLSDKISRTEIRYFLTDMDAPLDWMTLDELFYYWIKNVRR